MVNEVLQPSAPTGGSPDHMLQDQSRELSRWLSTQPDARLHSREAAAAIAQPSAPSAEPAAIDMVLHCPKCGRQHIDAPEQNDRFLAKSDPPAAWSMPPWKNEPHRSHLCHSCGHIWRPADVPTNGVTAIKTKGKYDSAPTAPTPAQAAPVAAQTEWRKLALQFDAQRMSALWHLRALLQDPAGHADAAREFLAAPPALAAPQPQPLTAEQVNAISRAEHGGSNPQEWFCNAIRATESACAAAWGITLDAAATKEQP